MSPRSSYQSVRFFNEDTAYVPRRKKKLKEWIGSVIANYGKSHGDINFIFCSDAFLLDFNMKYLAKDFLTDVIAFDMSDRENILTGDVYISIDRVRENAKKYNKTIDNELHRVMVHGILHLIGWKDKTQEEKRIIHAEEDKCLELLKD